MGEKKAARESMVYKKPAAVNFPIDNHLKNNVEIFQMCKILADSLICVYGKASRYNPCYHAVEEALMFEFRESKGEKSYAS